MKTLDTALRTVLWRYRTQPERLGEIGICWHMERFGFSYSTLSKYMITWPKYSGNPRFPIEGDASLYMKEGKWKGERGRLREDLLLYMLNKIADDY